MPFSPKVFFILLFCFMYAHSAYGAGCDKHWDLRLGTGLNVDGLGSAQMLIAPALSAPWREHSLLWYGVEADFELIDYSNHVTSIVGVAPFLRVQLQGKKHQPFIEIGAGPNLSSDDHVGQKNIGGPFAFSLMGSAGVAFTICHRSAAVMLRFRHLSNGGLYHRNESLNTNYLLLSIGLQ